MNIFTLPSYMDIVVHVGQTTIIPSSQLFHLLN